MLDVLKHLKNTEGDDLIKQIDGFLVEERITPPPTIETIFRASGISKICPREEVIAGLQGITRKQEFGSMFVTAVRIGNDFHTWYQDEVLGRMGILYGRWKCRECEHIPEERNGNKRYTMHDVRECPSCGAENPAPEDRANKSLWEYVEDEYINEELGISGHKDGTIFHNGKFKLFELKTSNQNYFNKFKKNGPPENYADQMQMYMEIFEHDEGILLYQNKNTFGKAMMELKRDQDRFKFLVGKVEEFRTGMNTGILPERLCVKKDCPRAKECPVVEQCFATRE